MTASGQVDLDPAFVAALLAQNSGTTGPVRSAATAGPSNRDVLAMAKPILKSSVPEDDRMKLMVVLHSIDPAGVMSQHVNQFNGTNEPSCTLHDGLQLPHATPLTLRAAINDACTSAMFASLDMSRDTMDAIDEYRHVALALIGEIEIRAAKRAGQRGKGVKREEGEADPEDLATKAPPTKKFMLHRTVGPGQTIDLFTSAANLTENDLAQLASAPDTDVISVLGPTFKPGLPEPTLGDVNPQSEASSIANARGPPDSHDVQMLYYDPYSSFAPSFDSAGADAGLRDSTIRAVAKSRIREWDEIQNERATATLRVAADAYSLPPETTVLTEDDRAVLSELDVDPVAFEDGWRSLQQERAVSKKLERNAFLTAELMRARWKRLLEADDMVSSSTAPFTPQNQLEGKRASLLSVKEREVEAARELLSSFSAMLALRPRAATGSKEGAVSTALPPASALHAFLPRLLASMEREASYGGTLDVSDARALKDSEMSCQQQGQDQQMQLDFGDFGDISNFGYGGGGGELDISV